MSNYSQFQQQIAIAWAHACLVKFDTKHPDATGRDRIKEFSDALEGGLSIALKLVKDY